VTGQCQPRSGPTWALVVLRKLALPGRVLSGGLRGKHRARGAPGSTAQGSGSMQLVSNPEACCSLGLHRRPWHRT
jgi:hypothetical protein